MLEYRDSEWTQQSSSKHHIAQQANAHWRSGILAQITQ